MIIILEGIDCSGKSTIIKDLVESRLRQHQEPIVFKLSQKPQDNSEKEQEKVKTIYIELFKQAKRLNNNKIVIFDRAHPSEMVYSVKRGYDAMQDNFWWEFDRSLGKRALDKINILLIYCFAPDDVVRERMKTDKEEFMKEDELELLKTRYQTFLSKTHLPYIEVDTTKDRVANIATVKKILETHEFKRREN